MYLLFINTNLYLQTIFLFNCFIFCNLRNCVYNSIKKKKKGTLSPRFSRRKFRSLKRVKQKKKIKKNKGTPKCVSQEESLEWNKLKGKEVTWRTTWSPKRKRETRNLVNHSHHWRWVHYCHPCEKAFSKAGLALHNLRHHRLFIHDCSQCGTTKRVNSE